MFCKSMLVLPRTYPPARCFESGVNRRLRTDPRISDLSDINDYNAALPFFASRSNGRLLCAPRRIERQLDSRAITLPTEIFFSAQDFFDDPGVQHGSSFAPRSLRILAL